MNFIPWTADLLGSHMVKPCGCVYRRITLPIARVKDAYELLEACPQHGGGQ